METNKPMKQAASKPAKSELPAIQLKDLPELTKDFLLASSGDDTPVGDVARNILNKAAGCEKEDNALPTPHAN